MAKTQIKRKGFFSRLSKSQRISLITLIVLAVVLHVVVIVAQMRTRTSPYARMAPDSITPVCTGLAKTLSVTSCKGKTNQFSRISFTCDSSKTSYSLSSACTTRGALVSRANAQCLARCKAARQITPTTKPSVTPIPCTARVSAVVGYIPCNTDSSKLSGIVVVCSNNNTTKRTVNSTSCTTKDTLLQQANDYCQKTCVSINPTTKPTTQPTAQPTTACSYAKTVCAAVYSPVCGTDGKTYGNSCEAKRNCVSVQCNGSCPCAKVTTTPTPMIQRPSPIYTTTPTPMIQRPAY